MVVLVRGRRLVLVPTAAGCQRGVDTGGRHGRSDLPASAASRGGVCGLQPDPAAAPDVDAFSGGIHASLLRPPGLLAFRCPGAPK